MTSALQIYSLLSEPLGKPESCAICLDNNALSLMQCNYLFLVEFNLNVSKLLSLNIFSFDYNYKLVRTHLMKFIVGSGQRTSKETPVTS